MKWFKILYVQVLIAIIAGLLVGHYFSEFAPTAKLISEGFINLVKMLIAPIIFVTVVLGIAGVGNMKKVGRVGGKAILYFEIVTTLALLIGLVVANWIQPGSGVDISGVKGSSVTQYTEQAKSLNWGEFLLHIIPSNIFKSFAEGDILQILFFSVLFGFALIKIGPSAQPIVNGIGKISTVLFYIMKMIMRVAPIGAFGGMAFTIGHYGLKALQPLAQFDGECIHNNGAVYFYCAQHYRPRLRIQPVEITCLH